MVHRFQERQAETFQQARIHEGEAIAIAGRDFASACELSSLLVHRLQAAQSLRRVECELLAYQAFIDRRPARTCGNDQLDSRCS